MMTVVKEGGLDAESIVAGQFRPLTRFAFLLSGRADVAEDVVAEVLARAWPALGRGTVRDPGAYLRRAVVNELGRRRRRAIRPHPTEPGANVETAEKQVVERDRLRRALAELPLGQRAVIVLRFWEDRSEIDTGSILGVSTGTVKTQSHRGLHRLREILEESNDE